MQSIALFVIVVAQAAAAVNIIETELSVLHLGFARLRCGQLCGKMLIALMSAVFGRECNIVLPLSCGSTATHWGGAESLLANLRVAQFYPVLCEFPNREAAVQYRSVTRSVNFVV